MSEKDLIERLRKGDEAAFERFYQKYYPAVFRFIHARVSDREIAKEIVNKSFFYFFEALRDFKGKSRLKTFLFSIAKHKLIDFYRKKKLKQVFLSHLPSQLREGLCVFLDQDINQMELRDKIEKTFLSLPNDYTRILRLKYIEGLKVKEIALKLKMSFKATESLLFRARKAFVQIFQKTQ